MSDKEKNTFKDMLKNILSYFNKSTPTPTPTPTLRPTPTPFVTPTPAYNEEGLLAARETIAQQEGMNNKNAVPAGRNVGNRYGYDKLFNYHDNPNIQNVNKMWKDHPREPIFFTNNKGEKNASTAAGRYQILDNTYDWLQKIDPTLDFSPESQDKMANMLLGYRLGFRFEKDSKNKTNKYLNEHGFDKDTNKLLLNEWTSFAKSFNKPEQEKITQDFFSDRLKKHLEFNRQRRIKEGGK